MLRGTSGGVKIVEGTLMKPRLTPEAGGASELFSRSLTGSWDFCWCAEAPL